MARKAKKRVHTRSLGALGAAAVVLLGALMLSVVAAALDFRCTGTLVAIGRAKICAESARDPAAWQKGLADREMLTKGNGMLFVFPDRSARAFWMKGMRFPLDMIWIKNRHVVGFETRVAADGGVRQIVTPPVDAVLEINAGDVQRLGVHVGDRVQW